VDPTQAVSQQRVDLGASQHAARVERPGHAQDRWPALAHERGETLRASTLARSAGALPRNSGSDEQMFGAE